MSGVSYLKRMPSGFPGAVSRQANATTEPQSYGATAFTEFGMPGKMVAGRFVPIASGDTAAVLYGFLVRPYPTQQSSPNEPLGIAAPPTSGICDVLRRGYMTVKCRSGSPAAGGQVYIRVGAATADKPIGGIEAAADGTNTITIPATFMSPVDESGIVEIAYNI